MSSTQNSPVGTEVHEAMQNLTGILEELSSAHDSPCLSDSKKTCSLCQKNINEKEEFQTLREKGVKKINQISEILQDTIRVELGGNVHTTCRRDYTLARRIQCDDEEKCPKKLRSNQHPFKYKEECLFCGIGDLYSGRKTNFKLIQIRSADFEVQVRIASYERNDEWKNTVIDRIAYIKANHNDLHAADAKYHNQCSVNYRTNRNIPQIFSPNKKTESKKQPMKCEIKHAAFLKVVKYLEENDDETNTLSSLAAKMKEYIENDDMEPYSTKYLKKQLETHFDNDIRVTKVI